MVRFAYMSTRHIAPSITLLCGGGYKHLIKFKPKDSDDEKFFDVLPKACLCNSASGIQPELDHVFLSSEKEKKKKKKAVFHNV